MEMKTMSVRSLQPSINKKSGFARELRTNLPLFIMLIPGALILLVNNYIPMFGIVIAFKRYQFFGDFFTSLFKSEWVGFKNFDFFFKSPDAWNVTRNTVLYNVAFIILGLVIPVFLAISLNELKNKHLSKTYQSIMFLPYFLSWIIISYLVYSFFSQENGFVNRNILSLFGIEPVAWYSETKFWPFILTFFQLWKYTGYNVVVYLAAISGIDAEFYEAAAIDGATKFQQVKSITLPLLQPLMIIMTLVAVGRIFNADFGLFYNVPKDSGSLYDVTNVIDTYVFRAMRNSNNIGMSAAAGAYQAILGCITVITANFIVKKIDSEKGLF
jgi:putative aldouronate transport system permease protein